MASLLNWIIEPFEYPFMLRALITAIIIGIVCAVLSCYLVLRGWSLMGDAISHAVLPGIVVAFVLGLPLIIGAFASGLLCALATGYIKQHSRVKEDTVMGVIFSGMFALGLVLFSQIDTDQHLMHILFGNILGVTNSQFYQTIVIVAMTLTIILLKYKDFMLYCFDPNHCSIIGLPTKLLHYTLLSLLALTIVVALQAVGVILATSLLIGPGIIAFLLARTFNQMLVIANIVSVLSCMLGVLISFHIDGATAPCIVMIQTAFFIIAFSINQLKTWRIGKNSLSPEASTH